MFLEFVPSAIVIDDDLDLRMSLSEYLQISGINVLDTGCNGKEALELYQKHRPDVVLLDVLMPQYDGVYALKRIMEFEPTAKIIIITASVGDETLKRLIDNQVSGIIYKPYDIQEITGAIGKVIAGQKVIPENRHWESIPREVTPQRST